MKNLPSGPPPLIVHTDWSRSWGGQEIRTLTELREMQKLGYRVALVVPQGAELATRAEREGIPVHQVTSFNKFSLSSWAELYRLIRSLRPTILNTHSSTDSWMGGAVGRLLGVPLILRTRHILSPISSKIGYNALPHCILTCSKAIAEQMQSQGVRQDKLVVTPTGNDENTYRYDPVAREQIRNQYNIHKDTLVLGNVGFLRHYKGHSFILQTIAALPENFIGMIVGGGEKIEELQKLAKQLSIEKRIILTDHQENPEHFFSAFDILFFSSNEAEGISQALVQGMLNGLPVLGCNIPSTTEAIQHIAHHRLVEYNDVATATQYIQELAQTPLRDQELMEKQRTLIAKQYGIAKMLDTLLQVYKKHGITPPGISA